MFESHWWRCVSASLLVPGRARQSVCHLVCSAGPCPVPGTVQDPEFGSEASPPAQPWRKGPQRRMPWERACRHSRWSARPWQTLSWQLTRQWRPHPSPSPSPQPGSLMCVWRISLMTDRAFSPSSNPLIPLLPSKPVQPCHPGMFFPLIGCHCCCFHCGEVEG